MTKIKIRLEEIKTASMHLHGGRSEYTPELSGFRGESEK